LHLGALQLGTLQLGTLQLGTLTDAFVALLALEAVAMAAAWILRRREAGLERYLSYLVSLATGVLLATALLHLLPEAIEQLGNRPLVWYLLGGTFLVLFGIEQIFTLSTGAAADAVLEHELHAHHRHGNEHGHGDEHGMSSAKPVNLLVASGLHSFIDGVTVATAFAAGPRIGWITALAIGLHEVPHRVGDFALLVHLRYAPGRALKLAALTSVGAFLGLALVGLAGLGWAGGAHWLLPVSAASFLYIAAVNLLPELRHERRRLAIVLQMVCLVAGAALVALVAGLPES
jgi:zinc and cadmium transporter